MPKAAVFAVIAAALVSLHPTLGGAQTVERLSRPVQTSAMGADGKLTVSGDATFGNLLVDQYAALGRKATARESDPKVVAALAGFMCSSSGIGGVTAYQIGVALKGMPKDERARLKARDAASMTALAATVVASLDGVSPDAVRADELLGPGAYHDAITGMRIAIDACRFFGLERKL